LQGGAGMISEGGQIADVLTAVMNEPLPEVIERVKSEKREAEFSQKDSDETFW